MPVFGLGTWLVSIYEYNSYKGNLSKEDSKGASGRDNFFTITRKSGMVCRGKKGSIRQYSSKTTASHEQAARHAACRYRIQMFRILMRRTRYDQMFLMHYRFTIMHQDVWNYKRVFSCTFNG